MHANDATFRRSDSSISLRTTILPKQSITVTRSRRAPDGGRKRRLASLATSAASFATPTP
jgi:hypothetical protein